MGNCLNCVGAGQQDNANLLSNGSDPALGQLGQLGQLAHLGDSHETLSTRPSLPYNEMPGNYYPAPAPLRERHHHSTETPVSRGIGIGVALSATGGGPIINEEEHQVRMAKRIGLIQHLPTRQFDGAKKAECVICMMELVTGEQVRYLPCMHTYHALCIDDWLLRSLTCPTCMEPVDAALINSYHPTT